MKAHSLVSLSITAALLVGVAGCDSEADGSDASAPATSTIEGVAVTGEFEEEPTIEVDGLTVDEPVDAVLIAGDGDEVSADDTVNYRFRMVYAESGDDVSGNYAESAPQQMDLSQQTGIIADAVVGATVGSRVAIAFTAKDLLGSGQASQYGMRGKDGLVMVLDVVSLTGEPLEGPDGEAVDPEPGAPVIVEKDDAVTGVEFDDASEKPSGKLQVISLVEAGL